MGNIFKKNFEVGAMGNPMRGKDNKSMRSMAFKDVKDQNSPWRSVLSLASRSRRAKGEQLQLGKELMFLERGKVRLAQQTPEGAEKIIWHIGEGCIFGETPFFDHVPNESGFTCMTSCLIYTFSSESVSQICKERPDLLLNLVHSLARKVRILSSQTAALSLDSVLVRFCKFLSQRIVPDSSPLVANIGISQHEMASLLGVHRVSLYRVLHQQIKRGLFGPITGDTMTILRPDDFYKLAGVY